MGSLMHAVGFGGHEVDEDLPTQQLFRGKPQDQLANITQVESRGSPDDTSPMTANPRVDPATHPTTGTTITGSHCVMNSSMTQLASASLSMPAPCDACNMPSTATQASNNISRAHSLPCSSGTTKPAAPPSLVLHATALSMAKPTLSNIHDGSSDMFKAVSMPNLPPSTATTTSTDPLFSTTPQAGTSGHATANNPWIALLLSAPPPSSPSSKPLNTTPALPPASCPLRPQPAGMSATAMPPAPTAAMVSAAAASTSTPPAFGSHSLPDRLSPADFVGERVSVVCNGLHAVFLIASQTIVCRCEACAQEEVAGAKVMSPTEFERHAGLAASKKWRRSIKVEGSVEPLQSVGRWLDAHGYKLKDDAEIEAGKDAENARLAAERSADRLAAKYKAKLAKHLLHSNELVAREARAGWQLPVPAQSARDQEVSTPVTQPAQQDPALHPPPHLRQPQQPQPATLQQRLQQLQQLQPPQLPPLRSVPPPTGPLRLPALQSRPTTAAPQTLQGPTTIRHQHASWPLHYNTRHVVQFRTRTPEGVILVETKPPAALPPPSLRPVIRVLEETQPSPHREARPLPYLKQEDWPQAPLRGDVRCQLPSNREGKPLYHSPEATHRPPVLQTRGSVQPGSGALPLAKVVEPLRRTPPTAPSPSPIVAGTAAVASTAPSNDRKRSRALGKTEADDEAEVMVAASALGMLAGIAAEEASAGEEEAAPRHGGWSHPWGCDPYQDHSQAPNCSHGHGMQHAMAQKGARGSTGQLDRSSPLEFQRLKAAIVRLNPGIRRSVNAGPPAFLPHGRGGSHTPSFPSFNSGASSNGPGRWCRGRGGRGGSAGAYASGRSSIVQHYEATSSDSELSEDSPRQPALYDEGVPTIRIGPRQRRPPVKADDMYDDGPGPRQAAALAAASAGLGPGISWKGKGRPRSLRGSAPCEPFLEAYGVRYAAQRQWEFEQDGGGDCYGSHGTRRAGLRRRGPPGAPACPGSAWPAERWLDVQCGDGRHGVRPTQPSGRRRSGDGEEEGERVGRSYEEGERVGRSYAEVYAPSLYPAPLHHHQQLLRPVRPPALEQLPRQQQYPSPIRQLPLQEGRHPCPPVSSWPAQQHQLLSSRELQHQHALPMHPQQRPQELAWRTITTSSSVAPVNTAQGEGRGPSKPASPGSHQQPPGKFHEAPTPSSSQPPPPPPPPSGPPGRAPLGDSLAMAPAAAMMAGGGSTAAGPTSASAADPAAPASTAGDDGAGADVRPPRASAHVGLASGKVAMAPAAVGVGPLPAAFAGEAVDWRTIGGPAAVIAAADPHLAGIAAAAAKMAAEMVRQHGAAGAAEILLQHGPQPLLYAPAGDAPSTSAYGTAAAGGTAAPLPDVELVTQQPAPASPIHPGNSGTGGVVAPAAAPPGTEGRCCESPITPVEPPLAAARPAESQERHQPPALPPLPPMAAPAPIPLPSAPPPAPSRAVQVNRGHPPRGIRREGGACGNGSMGGGISQGVKRFLESLSQRKAAAAAADGSGGRSPEGSSPTPGAVPPAPLAAATSSSAALAAVGAAASGGGAAVAGTTAEDASSGPAVETQLTTANSVQELVGSFRAALGLPTGAEATAAGTATHSAGTGMLPAAAAAAASTVPLPVPAVHKPMRLPPDDSRTSPGPSPSLPTQQAAVAAATPLPLPTEQLEGAAGLKPLTAGKAGAPRPGVLATAKPAASAPRPAAPLLLGVTPHLYTAVRPTGTAGPPGSLARPANAQLPPLYMHRPLLPSQLMHHPLPSQMMGRPPLPSQMMGHPLLPSQMLGRPMMPPHLMHMPPSLLGPAPQPSQPLAGVRPTLPMPSSLSTPLATSLPVPSLLQSAPMPRTERALLPSCINCTADRLPMELASGPASSRLAQSPSPEHLTSPPIPKHLRTGPTPVPYPASLNGGAVVHSAMHKPLRHDGSAAWGGGCHQLGPERGDDSSMGHANGSNALRRLSEGSTVIGPGTGGIRSWQRAAGDLLSRHAEPDPPPPHHPPRSPRKEGCGHRQSSHSSHSSRSQSQEYESQGSVADCCHEDGHVCGEEGAGFRARPPQQVHPAHVADFRHIGPHHIELALQCGPFGTFSGVLTAVDPP